MAIKPGAYTKVSGIAPAFKSALCTGAAAGDVTAPGVKVGDVLVLVQDMTANTPDATDEFTITAADTINNSGGTSTNGHSVLVIWAIRDARLGY